MVEEDTQIMNRTVAGTRRVPLVGRRHTACACHFWKATIVGYAVLLGAAFFLPLAGCGGDGLKKIHGTVTYRGQPIGKGRITFLPPDGNGPSAAIPIVDGKYELRVTLGRKLVQIDGYKVIGKRPYNPYNPSGPMVDDQVQIVPERYNAKSELFREITAGESIYDFDLDDPQGAVP